MPAAAHGSVTSPGGGLGWTVGPERSRVAIAFCRIGWIWSLSNGFSR